MIHSVECPLCGKDHDFTVSDGEPATYWYPGAAPEVDWRRAGCRCGDSPVVKHDEYWELMESRAVAEAFR